jgi:hypothetical protein
MPSFVRINNGFAYVVLFVEEGTLYAWKDL